MAKRGLIMGGNKMSAEQDMKDLLFRLEQKVFSGEETTHLPTKVELEYSQNKIKLTTIHQGKLPSTLEMVLDANYKVIDCVKTNGTQQKQFSQKDLQDYEDHGFFTNFIQYDPRYTIHHAKDIKEIQPGVYRMRIDSPKLKTANDLLGITSYAEIHVENGDLKKMQTKMQFKSGKEQLGRNIIFS